MVLQPCSPDRWALGLFLRNEQKLLPKFRFENLKALICQMMLLCTVVYLKAQSHIHLITHYLVKSMGELLSKYNLAQRNPIYVLGVEYLILAL